MSTAPDALPKSEPPPPSERTSTRPQDASRRLSELPPAESAARLASQLLAPEDLDFVKVLRDSGLARDLEGDELLRVATALAEGEGIARRIDILEAYYAASGDAELAKSRRCRDRFFCQRESEPVTAIGLVEKLAELAPEVGAVVLERIGGGDDGPLILRAGVHIAALLDDYEESLDGDDIDLREIDDARHAPSPMITVRGLVRALNVLLDRCGVRERFVAIRSDDHREVYVATSVTDAIALARGGWLEDDDVEEVMELGGW